MEDNISRYTMEELWGTGQAEIAATVEIAKKEGNMYCVKLNNGGYIMIGHNNEVMEMNSKTFADTFESIKEAERFCRENWLEANIEIWENQEPDEED